MVGKIEIVESLGEGAILLPALIASALEANDRLKIRLTLLQEASSRAADPGRAPLSLDAERRAVGLDAPAFDALVSGARAVEFAGFHRARRGASGGWPRRGPARDGCSDRGGGKRRERRDPDPLADSTRRFARFRGRPRHPRAGRALVSARRGGRDSLHLLVMDLHKEINRLAAATAVEEIDGAKAPASTRRDAPA